METLEIIEKVFNGLGSIGVLIVVVVLYNMGLLKKPGSGDTDQNEINAEMARHASVANDEMGEVKTSIAVIDSRLGRIEDDIKEIKNEVKRK